MQQSVAASSPACLPVNPLDRVLAIGALAGAVLYLLLIELRPYPGDVYLKVSMCTLLAVLAWRGAQRLFALALLCSAVGDMFLALDGERWFVPGLTSFLVTQLLYAALFVRIARGRAARMSAPRHAAVIVIPLFAVAYGAFLWPKLEALALPVAIYIGAITAMAMLALRVPVVAVPLGAAAFMVSDSLIALDKFIWSAAWIGPAIWATYAFAQLAIARGMVEEGRGVRGVGRGPE